MPGLDHEVHETVRQSSDAVYGCSNGVFKPGYYAPDRDHDEYGVWETSKTYIPHRMSTECRYDLSLTDSKCRECAKRGSGEAYSEMIRRDGT